MEFTSAWTNDVIDMLQDEDLKIELEIYNHELDEEWMLFKKVLKAYPSLFPTSFVNKELFFNIYGQVCTRCFGEGVESTSMIPMADNFNHSCVDINS